MIEEITPTSPELQMLHNNKEDGFRYRQRRHADWDENYMLYRDKVVINRLIQRQSVNLPLMKQTIRTLLKDVDDMPVLYFENLDNDKEAELFLNEYWKWTVEQNNMDLQDIVDKRQVFLFGRSFDQWQIVDGRIVMTIQDPEDILVSRYIDPTDLNSSRFLIHTHIFQPLSKLKQNPDYDKKCIKNLEQYYKTTMGLMKLKDNLEMLEEKNQKLINLGVSDVDSPVLGEAYVELSLHFVYRNDEKGKDGKLLDEQLFLYVEADDREILMKKPLEEVIGVTEDHYWRTHFPYNSWADDVERQDFWSDGIADMVRTPNKVLNTFFSQLVENRTLRNFNMHYYNSNLEGFAPQSFNPVPWGWYGIPIPLTGKIDDVLKMVEVPDLSESLDEMQFIIGMTEKATGATATQQGAQNTKQVTLGEVQLALSEAKERIKGMSKFYTPAWKQRGRMFLKLIEAAGGDLDVVKIYKKGKNTSDIYGKEIGPSDWETKSGYRERVWSQDEKDTEDTNRLQKLNAAKTIMPGNIKLEEIYQRKVLEFSDLTPEEINDVMLFEQQKRDALVEQQAIMGQQGGMTMPSPDMAGATAPVVPPQMGAPQ
jgi:hypothetical protein